MAFEDFTKFGGMLVYNLPIMPALCSKLAYYDVIIDPGLVGGPSVLQKPSVHTTFSSSLFCCTVKPQNNYITKYKNYIIINK